MIMKIHVQGYYCIYFTPIIIFVKIPTLFLSSRLPLFLICIFINFKIIPIHTDLVFSFFHIIHKCSMKQESVRQLGICQCRKYRTIFKSTVLLESHFALATLPKYIKIFQECI